MAEDQVKLATFIDEAKRLHYSRRTILKRGSLLGLSLPAIHTALAASGVSSPHRSELRRKV
jgi:hypothetical protein